MLIKKKEEKKLVQNAVMEKPFRFLYKSDGDRVSDAVSDFTLQEKSYASELENAIHVKNTLNSNIKR